jgi:hypothetical protein
MSAKFKTNDVAYIKAYKNDPDNCKGRVVTVFDDGRFWVSNLNMPFCGSVSEIFTADELEKVVK